jgi:nascent polypeptide-associated complex subunit beta
MSTADPEIIAARARLRERLGVGTRVGGKNSARLQRRAVAHKSGYADDKKLQATIKRMGLSQLPGVDEVAMIRKDGKAICFNQPKVHVAINSNTFIVTGAGEEKTAEQLLSSVPELTSDILKKFASEWQKMQETNAATDTLKLNSQNSKQVSKVSDADDSDEIPDLVTNFEATASVEKCS